MGKINAMKLSLVRVVKLLVIDTALITAGLVEGAPWDGITRIQFFQFSGKRNNPCHTTLLWRRQFPTNDDTNGLFDTNTPFRYNHGT